MVIRGPGGVGRQLGAEHSQRLESYFQSIPGVQLVACSTVANAKALLKSAIRSDNPIIFFEHVLLYNVKGEVLMRGSAGWESGVGEWLVGWGAGHAKALLKSSTRSDYPNISFEHAVHYHVKGVAQYVCCDSRGSLPGCLFGSDWSMAG